MNVIKRLLDGKFLRGERGVTSDHYLMEEKIESGYLVGKIMPVDEV